MRLPFKNLKTGVALLVVFAMNSEEGFAADTMYWITCNCDPAVLAEVTLEIGTQVSPHSHEFGSISGFNGGDVVVVQDWGGVAERYVHTTFGSWLPDSDADFVFSTGLTGFGDRVDLAGGFLPQPPWTPLIAAGQVWIPDSGMRCAGPSCIVRANTAGVASLIGSRSIAHILAIDLYDEPK